MQFFLLTSDPHLAGLASNTTWPARSTRPKTQCINNCPALVWRIWPEAVLREDLLPNSHHPYMEIQLHYAPKHTGGTGVQKIGSRCAGLMRQNLRYLAAAEGGLYAEGLQSVTIMSVCKHGEECWRFLASLGLHFSK